MWRLGSGQDCSRDNMETTREFMSWMSTAGRRHIHVKSRMAYLSSVDLAERPFKTKGAEFMVRGLL